MEIIFALGMLHIRGRHDEMAGVQCMSDDNEELSSNETQITKTFLFELFVYKVTES
jgi:hypothetical protein